jgi:hypothetical protein
LGKGSLRLPSLFTFAPFPFTFPVMSEGKTAYNENYIKAWACLSIIVGLVLFSMFVCGDTFLQAGHIVWDLIRWLARPII